MMILKNLATEFGNPERVAGTKYRRPFPGHRDCVLFGSIPIVFPGVPVPVKLGLAGGPLIIAIFISRYGSVIPVISYVTQSANYMVREIGIALFLSSVGLGAGATFLSMLFSHRVLNCY